MTAEQQTTPEQRAALRQRYTPEPVPKCGTCKKRMVQCYDIWNSASDATYIVYRCPLNHSSYDARKGDSDILAAVADADALAGALATVGRFRDSLAFYRTEATRYRAALKAIQGWDCLNPPQSDLCADFPWLRRLVDEALEPATKGAEGDE